MGGYLRKAHSDEHLRFGRDFGHWSFSEDENFFDDLATVPIDTKVLSLRRDDLNWECLVNLGKLEEITAISPTKKQLALIYACVGLKRLRLVRARSATFNGLENLVHLEELACFSVSGPKSLGPVAALPRLRSLLIENMRSLKDWSELSKASRLKCLCISGGFVEELQKIQSLSFLGNLTALQHLQLGYVRFQGEGPAFKGLRDLRNLEKLYINPYSFTLDDHAYLEAIVPPEKIAVSGLFLVEGSAGELAVTLQDIEKLTGDEFLFEPRVKAQNGLPFTRGYRGTKKEVLKRVEAFQNRYDEIHSAARAR